MWNVVVKKGNANGEKGKIKIQQNKNKKMRNEKTKRYLKILLTFSVVTFFSLFIVEFFDYRSLTFIQLIVNCIVSVALSVVPALLYYLILITSSALKKMLYYISIFIFYILILFISYILMNIQGIGL